MCKTEVYERFRRLAIKIDGERMFHTKLGDRLIYCVNLEDRALIVYYEKDLNDQLFYLIIQSDGTIKTLYKTIDSLAIFSAVYELECILYEEDYKEKENVLEYLFENTNPYGLAQYR